MPEPITHSVRILNPWFLEQDHTGVPAAGYRVYTLVAGSVNTLLTTYSDHDLLVPNTNPVALNIYGEALIFTAEQYIKLVYTSPTGDLTSPIWTQDYVATVPYRDTNSIGAASGTANNIYVVNTVPSYTSIPDGFSLVMLPDISNLDTVITTVFTGVGIDDAVFSGPYVGSTSSVFQVQIDGVASPNTFKWRKDSGSWTAGVVITAAPQILQEGISVLFSTIINHTLNDLWTLTVRPATYLNFCGLGPKIIYKNSAGTLEVLSGGDIIAGIPAHLDYSLSQDCWILINPSLPALSSLPRTISRRIVTGNSSLLMGDAGNEVCYTGAGGHTFTLLACSIAANYVFDLVNAGTGDWTINVAGGTDKIAYPGVVGGITSLTVGSGGHTTIRLVTNGVDWNILADVQVPSKIVSFDALTDWVCPTGITKIWASGCGGGGGGDTAGNGGGAGEQGVKIPLTVVPGTTYTITTGYAGTGGNPGTDGGPTTISGGLLSLAGGTHGASTGADGVTTIFTPGGFGTGGDNAGSINGEPGYLVIEY